MGVINQLKTRGTHCGIGKKMMKNLEAGACCPLISAGSYIQPTVPMVGVLEHEFYFPIYLE